MLRFYGSLIRDIPKVLRGTHEAWAYWGLSLAVPVVLWLRPEWRPMTETPWLIGVPIGLSVAYGMLRVNYARFEDLASKLQESDRKLAAALEVVPDFKGSIDAIAVAEFKHGKSVVALVSARATPS